MIQSKKSILQYFIFAGILLSLSSCASKSDVASSDESTSGLLTVQHVDIRTDNETSLLSVKGSKEAKYNIFKLMDPERVVVDLIDAQPGPDLPKSLAGNELVKEVRINSVEDSLSSLVRVEIVLKSSANYLADQNGDSISVRLIGAEPIAAKSADEPAPVVEASSAKTKNADVKPISEPPPAEMPEPVVKTPTPEKIPEVEMPEIAKVEKSSPKEEVQISAEPPKADLNTELVPSPTAESEGSMKDEMASETEKMFPEAKPVGKLNAGKKKSKSELGGESLVALKPVKTQEISSTSFTEGGSLLTDLDTKIYTGRRVSLEFQEADVQDIIRLIADVSKLNIVTGDDVKGKLSLKLIDVPWDQALDIMLATLNLDKMQHGNIVRIAPSEKLRKEREVALANDKAAKQLEPLRLKLLNVNYAKASELSSRVRNLLSERGTVDVDDRTNTLIIKDIREHLSRAENLVKALDTQTPQVRIEARIVLADDSSAKNLGIQWGPSLKMDSTNNKSRGIQFPREIAAGSVDASAIDLSEYAVDALPGTANLGTLGLRLGSVSDIFKLDLKLQYLENESLGRVVSRPSISVLDNKTAKITQGARVPFLSSSSSGTNVSFQDVGINIEVTPQITSDGAVILRIATKSNEVQNQSVGGNPITTIREANTEMLVKSGKTAVLGGVFKTSETRSSAGVPGLMRLPLLGWLFSNSSKTQTKEETLVFITPYILNDNRLANAAPNSEANLEP